MNRAAEAIRKYRLLDGVRTVTVGLSGGADSVALLHFLKSRERLYRIEVRAVHVDHGLRGEESARDAAFAGELCGRLGVPFALRRVEVRAEAARTGESTELCARRLRYGAFAEFLGEGAAVATAHTASDNAETMLFQLARGSGSRGLAGIPPRRGGYIRPLILCPRAEIETYCAREHLPFVTDSTNADEAYTRNYIRHTLIPGLRSVNPDLEGALGRLADSLREDDDALTEMARAALDEARREDGYDRRRLAALPDALLHRALRLAAEQADSLTPPRRRMEQMAALVRSRRASGEIDGKKGTVLRAEYDTIAFARGGAAQGFAPVELHEGENPLPDGGMLLLRRGGPANVHDLFNKIWLDCDKIASNLWARSRREGDALCLREGGGTRSVKKWMIDNKIPRGRRERLPVILSDGQVAAVIGIGTALAFRPDSGTKKTVELEYRE
ncbi:tRNA lysidine(34) synthetase TilS [Feifania hominis]|uniref:tRNA(Ile)-lysidine synthase n=1 Tax=Feifania hominis TaxID=2763660 RepID=A0A926HU73_9FIRM|nr:tRNA lysidine(34) synthetase TilS [Feifania hominis]MBC8536614.1 tRNA lysidine(34) synthetase TilS [Feifania hominis]